MNRPSATQWDDGLWSCAHRPDIAAPAIGGARVLAAEYPELPLEDNAARAPGTPRRVFRLPGPVLTVRGGPDVVESVR